MLDALKTAVKVATQGRSSKWPAVRRAHLAAHPACEACGTRSRREVHHVVPFHVDPSRELDPANLVTLCESASHNCHLIFGHLLDWKLDNPQVRADASAYRARHDSARTPGPR